MARQIITTLVDDIDGGTDGVETFKVNGFEIDLGGSHASALREQLDLVVKYGRQTVAATGKGGKAAAVGRKRVKNPDTAKLREWALANGKIQSTRGRIPEAVEAEWRAVQQQAA